MAAPNGPMHGKVCMVTGATSGIGKETAVGLAKLGATVVGVVRDRARGEALVREIAARTGNDATELMIADLASQRSIRQGVDDFKAKHDRLHVLVNQAGLAQHERVLTEDGIETMLAVNHLAYFLLTNLLLDVLKASAPARVVNGTGAVFNAGDIHFDDPNFDKKWSWFKALAQSKLGNVLFTYELARRLEGTGVTVTCFHPGGVKTNLGTDMPGFMGLVLKLARPFWSTPEKGAEPAIYLASSPEVEGVTGKYFDKTKQQPTRGKPNDPELARRCWELSAKLTKLEG